MVGIIKNLFSKNNNYYVQLDENQASESKQQQSQSQLPQNQAQTNNQEKPSQSSSNSGQQQSQSSPNPVQQQSTTFQNNGQGQLGQLKGETFAPTHLMPKASPFRRRPGANMDSFKELARQVNIGPNQ